MAKIDIISGFLGAGKTTLIKKLLSEALTGEQVVLIENEFGEIGIDGGFLKDASINITEMNSGCICCSLVGDFDAALRQVVEQFHPDRIIIEPSGVGKLSDVALAVKNVAEDTGLEINSMVTVADANKCKMYMKNFGEFYNNQVESANTIVLSRTQNVSQEKLEAVAALLREHNADAVIITTPWDDLSGAQILAAMEHPVSLADLVFAEEEEEHEHHHHHHDDEDEHEHHHHHHHDDDDEEEEHEHHHHHHDDEDEEDEHHHHHHEDEDEEYEHHHHHHDDENEEDEHHHHHHDDDDEDEHEHHHHHHEDGETCSCGHHHHHHHHHHGHDADEIFQSWGVETPRKYTKEEIENILKTLSETQDYGIILRSKGMVPAQDGTWIYFDMVPEECDIREGAPEYTGRLCVIGSGIKEDKLKELFML